MTAVYLGAWAAGSSQWHEQRQAAVGGSDVAVLMGLSPWASLFSLYHERKGLIPPQDEKPEMSWGKRLEPVIVQAYAEMLGSSRVELKYEPGAVYAHPQRRWQVCSPDALILGDEDSPDRVAGGLEVKTDRFPDGWGPSGGDEIPVYYRCQVQWCMDVFGVPSWDVAFLCSGSDFRTYTIQADAEDQAALRAAAEDFLRRLRDNDRPSIDDHTQTYEAVRKLYPGIDQDLDVEVDPDLAAGWALACHTHKAAEAAKRASTSALLDAMGDARRALVNGTPVARRQPGRGGAVSLYPVTQKDVKAA